MRKVKGRLLQAWKVVSWPYQLETTHSSAAWSPLSCPSPLFLLTFIRSRNYIFCSINVIVFVTFIRLPPPNKKMNIIFSKFIASAVLNLFHRSLFVFLKNLDTFSLPEAIPMTKIHASCGGRGTSWRYFRIRRNPGSSSGCVCVSSTRNTKEREDLLQDL